MKKSRFISIVVNAPNLEMAKRLLQQTKAEHSSARHHCWAMIAGHPKDSQCLGFSDDGEPTGTAGKPMLAQLQGSGLGQVMAIVVRYSGGVKLGTGGLVRAYGQGVQQALALLETQPFMPSCRLKLLGSYDDSGKIEHFLESQHIVVLARNFTQQLSWDIELAIEQRSKIENQLNHLCSGNIAIQRL
ncbi:YigZ family protein [Alginatibacterium sediminis]|uniref:YigZ family protein n=1 Tax=Alginatibacterium sediminis TaxID=2164068 RepID=UPI001F2D5C19